MAVYDYAKNVTTYRVEMDLGTMERAHFTAIDYVTMSYVGVDEAGQTSFLADLDLPSLPRAAEYVGGHVFLITDDNSLCVADDEDLSLTQRIGALDPTDFLGITNGIDSTHFAPGEDCIRAQVVTFLWRAKGSPEAAAEADFTDLAPGAFYMKAVSWAVEAGVTMGLGDGSFGVGNSCNRAETVTFLYRAMAD